MRITSGGAAEFLGTINSVSQISSTMASNNISNFYGIGGTVTGSASGSALFLDTTWNTTGNPNGISFNVTNTASGASSKLLNLYVDNVSQFSVSKAGEIQTGALTNGTAQPWKLGNAVSGTFTPNYYVIVEINGTTYSIPALQGLP
jgi:hypothetical protein